mmetsp:Transcript_100568/g.189638  ORF Transcript_100568/g.189638 Transcript_100568/m.189638 type:complete len:204 (+) Transcript_100568:1048-1659(+)
MCKQSSSQTTSGRSTPDSSKPGGMPFLQFPAEPLSASLAPESQASMSNACGAGANSGLRASTPASSDCGSAATSTPDRDPTSEEKRVVLALDFSAPASYCKSGIAATSSLLLVSSSTATSGANAELLQMAPTLRSLSKLSSASSVFDSATSTTASSTSTVPASSSCLLSEDTLTSSFGAFLRGLLRFGSLRGGLSQPSALRAA